jgi:hypothetical protein
MHTIESVCVSADMGLGRVTRVGPRTHSVCELESMRHRWVRRLDSIGGYVRGIFFSVLETIIGPRVDESEKLSPANFQCSSCITTSHPCLTAAHTYNFRTEICAHVTGPSWLAEVERPLLPRRRMSLTEGGMSMMIGGQMMFDDSRWRGDERLVVRGRLGSESQRDRPSPAWSEMVWCTHIAPGGCGPDEIERGQAAPTRSTA